MPSRIRASAASAPTGSAFQGEYKSLKMWTLRCSDSGDWALFLAANGDIQVRACKEATQLGLPPCVTGPLEKAKS